MPTEDEFTDISKVLNLQCTWRSVGFSRLTTTLECHPNGTAVMRITRPRFLAKSVRVECHKFTGELVTRFVHPWYLRALPFSPFTAYSEELLANGVVVAELLPHGRKSEIAILGEEGIADATYDLRRSRIFDQQGDVIVGHAVPRRLTILRAVEDVEFLLAFLFAELAETTD